MFKKVTDKIYSLTTNMKPVTKKKLVSSYISLFLSFVVLITSTISWFTIVQTVSVKSNVFTMYSSSGLRVNEGEDISNHIYLDDIYLYESSSVDGRNMFFPTKGTFSSNTSSMIFREGTAGDCNQTYIHKNFTLFGDSTLTEIYLKSYNITVDGQIFNGGTEITYDSSGKPLAQVKKQECPVRIAFISDSAEDPIVIDPTAIVDGHVKNYNAVKSVNNGVPSTERTNATSFSNHYFSYEQPLFKLFGTEPLEVTMVVWLEGTGGNCDKYAGKKISIDIELESNFTDTEIIRFVDDTLPDKDGLKPETNPDAFKWINQKGDCIVTMAYKVSNDKTADPNDMVTKTVVMKQRTATEWYAPIPKGVKENISFYRYSLTDEVIYNAWHTEKGINDELSDKASGWLGQMGRQLQESREIQGSEKNSVVYTAVRGNGYGVTENESQRLSPCIGFWDYTGSSGGGGGTVTPDDPDTGDLVQIGIAVNFSNKSWITANLSNKIDTYNMYAIYNTNGTEKALLIDTDTSSYQRCECKNKIIEKNSTLVRFELRSSSHTKVLNFNGNVIFNQNYNYTFNVNNDDTVG